MDWNTAKRMLASGGPVRRAGMERGHYLEADYDGEQHNVDGESFDIHRYAADGTDLGVFDPSEQDENAEWLEL